MVILAPLYKSNTKIMSANSIFKIALVPILLALFLYALQIIFGWLSEADNNSVILGVVSLSLLFVSTYFIIKKIYFTNE